jgi:endonuclease/exonuclease/phosphatase (EEP) superfamily protein YafD
MDRIDRLALAALAPLVLLAVVRALPMDDRFPLVAIEADLGWLLAPAWLGLALVAVRRRALSIALAAIPCLVHASLLAPLVMPRARADAPGATPLRIVTANLYAYQHHPETLARELATLDADVMILEELTPGWVAALEEAGVIGAFDPGSPIVARDDCFGIALLSRVPIVSTEVIDRGEVPAIRARLSLGEGRTVTVIGAHTLPPVGAEHADVWRAQVAALAADARDRDGPLIVAGDLNLTPFGRGYGALRDAGLRGAHELAGRGLATTWPNGRRSIPPMRLDHVLVSDEIDARAVREGVGAGSDHRPVIADLAIAR